MTPPSLRTSVDACAIRAGSSSAALGPRATQEVARPDWRQALPRLTGETVSLRELRLSDAAALLEMLSTEEVARFISPPPTSVNGFERPGERARERRARQGRGGEGRRTSQEFSEARAIPRSGDLVDRQGRVAAGESGLVFERALTLLFGARCR